VPLNTGSVATEVANQEGPHDHVDHSNPPSRSSQPLVPVRTMRRTTRRGRPGSNFRSIGPDGLATAPRRPASPPSRGSLPFVWVHVGVRRVLGRGSGLLRCPFGTRSSSCLRSCRWKAIFLVDLRPGSVRTGSRRVPTGEGAIHDFPGSLQTEQLKGDHDLTARRSMCDAAE
jgi:hypothetical protein